MKKVIWGVLRFDNRIAHVLQKDFTLCSRPLPADRKRIIPPFGSTYCRVCERNLETAGKTMGAIVPVRRIRLTILTCQNCERMGVALNDHRVTRHKCAGSWTITHEENIPETEIEKALGITRRLSRAE